MTRNARRPLLLLLTAAVAPAVLLTACASASPTAPAAPSGSLSRPSADAHVVIPAVPASDGKALTLVFRAEPGGPALATAILGLDGCEFTDLTVSAKDRTLGKYGSARSMASRVLQVAGVAWKLPPFQWPAA
jgi:hypothetical protein